MSVTAPAATTTDTGNTALGRARLAENFDTFLTLLTTQLKNQDPLSPMDSNQFTQQMVSMTGVEQQLQTNKFLEQLVGNTGSNMATAVSLIGKEVRATSFETGLVNDKAEWIYTLDREASAKLEVIDQNGRVVHAESVNGKEAGDHTFTWDGKDPSGSKQPEGTYALRVTAADTTGANVPTAVSVKGVVSSIEQLYGETMITINGGKVPWGHVTTVNQAPSTSTTAG